MFNYYNNSSAIKSIPKILDIIKNDLNYTLIYDQSTTAQEFFDYSNYSNLIYYIGHGIPNRTYNNYPKGEFVGFTVDDYFDAGGPVVSINLWTKDLITYNKDVKMIFMNCCFSGLNPGMSDFINVYNPDIYLGWKDEVGTKSDDFAMKFFENLAEEKTVKQSIDEAMNDIDLKVDLNVRGENETF